MAGKELPEKRRMLGKRVAHQRTNSKTGETTDVKESTFEYDGIDPNQYSPEVTAQDLAGFEADVYGDSAPTVPDRYVPYVNKEGLTEIGSRSFDADTFEDLQTNEFGDMFSSERVAVEVAVVNTRAADRSTNLDDEDYHNGCLDSIDEGISYIKKHVPYEQWDDAIAEYMYSGPDEQHIEMWATNTVNKAAYTEWRMNQLADSAFAEGYWGEEAPEGEDYEGSEAEEWNEMMEKHYSGPGGALRFYANERPDSGSADYEFFEGVVEEDFEMNEARMPNANDPKAEASYRQAYKELPYKGLAMSEDEYVDSMRRGESDKAPVYEPAVFDKNWG